MINVEYMNCIITMHIIILNSSSREMVTLRAMLVDQVSMKS